MILLSYQYLNDVRYIVREEAEKIDIAEERIIVNRAFRKIIRECQRALLEQNLDL